MTLKERKELLINETNRWIKKGENLYGYKIGDVDIRFDLKGKTAGQVIASKRVIRYNLNAISVDGGWEHLVNHTVPHEVAHLVQRTNPNWPKSRKANPSHGRYWKHVMAHFGVKATRCHSLNLPTARKTRKFLYDCKCNSGVQVGLNRHKKIQAGSARFSCRRCKSVIKFKAEI